jgi:TRAP-type C4-dicarboxylate transport system permease small subunit
MLEVVFRFLFGSSFIWIQEYNEYLLLYIPFLTGAWLLRNNDHVVVNLIDNILEKRSFHILNALVSILGALSMIIIVYYSTIVTLDILERGVTSTTVLRTPQFYVYIIIPIGSFVMLLEFSRQLFKAITLKNNSLLE